MIGDTLRAVATFVDDNASAIAWDQHQQLSDEQRSAKGEKIKAVADDLRTLAKASETRKVRYSEYEVLKDRLYAFGFSVLPKLAMDDRRAGEHHSPTLGGSRHRVHPRKRRRAGRALAEGSRAMISASQVSEARVLLGWTALTLATEALLCSDEVRQALDDVGIQHLGGLQLGAIRRAFEAAGVEFIPENGGGAGVRLRKVEN